MIELQGKKIAILGFGKEGQATFAYLKKIGIIATAILDAAPELKPEQVAATGGDAVRFVGGSGYMDGLDEYDLIFRSPGVPRSHPKLLAYANQDAIFSHIKLFFDRCPGSIIAVTGTKGKTTTTSLIYEILKRSGKKAFLGGNIGETPLDFMDQVTRDSLVVLEVSSFQAQDLHKSPRVGVILNVTHDHLDDGTFRAASHATNDEYLRAKAQLIANQTEDDAAILHPGLPELFRNSGRGRKVMIRPDDFRDWERKLLGDHSLENIGAAVLACREVGVADDNMRKTVAEFSGVPMRLQLVAEKKGVKYVNDSASTNPDSTIAAIRSFKGNVVLILGGSEKGLDYGELGRVILGSSHVKAIVAIGQVAPKIIAAVEGFQGRILTGAGDMAQIISQANSAAQTGDTVLLSPASASFGMFENSKDRGSQFDLAVEAL
jgi:UDP-N-acetylmuramoylalanine--D-glutamate ligase